MAGRALVPVETLGEHRNFYASAGEPFRFALTPEGRGPLTDYRASFPREDLGRYLRAEGVEVDDNTLPSYTFWNAMFGYRGETSDGRTWRVGLNIQNVFANDELVPIRAQPADLYSQYAAFDHYKPYDYMLYRIGAPRTISLRATLEF